MVPSLHIVSPLHGAYFLSLLGAYFLSMHGACQSKFLLRNPLMHQRDVRLHSYATFGALGSGAQGAGLLSENKRSAAPPEFATIHKLCLTAANNFHQISSSVLINHR